MNSKTFITASIAAGSGALRAIAPPLTTSAYVEVSPNTAAARSDTDTTLRLPTESATASTPKVEVDIPAATSFVNVRYVAMPSWHAELITEPLSSPITVDKTTLTDAVTTVFWASQPGSEIKDSEIRQFTCSIRAMPDAGKIGPSAIQRYSDGSVVTWSETGEGAKPPSPVRYVNDAPAAECEAHAATASATDATGAGASSDTLARLFGIGRLIVGTVGVVLSVVTLHSTVTG